MCVYRYIIHPNYKFLHYILHLKLNLYFYLLLLFWDHTHQCPKRVWGIIDCTKDQTRVFKTSAFTSYYLSCLLFVIKNTHIIFL